MVQQAASRHTQRWLIGGTLTAAVLVAAVVVHANGRGSQEAEKKPPEKTLAFNASEVVQPTQRALPAFVEFSGPLVAPNTAVVRAKGGGTLLALSSPEGTRVKAGQLLGTLDLEDLRQRVAERVASVDAARAQADQAQRNHMANEGLAKQNFIATTALEGSRSALETARAQHAVAQAQLQTMQVALRQANLTAPISGWVAKRHAVPGEKLQAEQAVLTVVDLSQLELAGLVGTHEVTRLAPGMTAELHIEGVPQAVMAKIARISPQSEPGTRSIGVTLSVPNAGETLRGGQYAVARVQLDDPQPRLTVPKTALVGTGGQQQVWVIDKGELKRRLVTTGRVDLDRGLVEVLSGLDGNSQVLAGRYENLREGGKASIVTKAQPKVELKKAG
jgi:membrane fusion protein, multidrug efflux system